MAEALSPQPALLDPQRRAINYLRISVTDRCNYRCTYCLPDDGVDHVDRADILSFEELCRLVSCFAAIGVRRVRLTGGEPTVRRDLVRLVAMIRQLPGIDEIALSTNGHLLTQLARPLRAAGIDRLNVSLDTLDASRFARITGGGDLPRVLAGIEAARAAGFSSIKLNAVAIKGFNDGEIGALCDYAWTRGLVPRFIEQMPMAGGATYVPGQLLSAAEIRALVAAAFPGTNVVPDDGGAARGAGPARYLRLADAGASGLDASDTGAPPRRFGIISPMTEHFCDTCNRVRLSAAGALHTCLAYDDAVDLRKHLRTQGEAAVIAAIRAAVATKRDGHQFGLIGIGGPRKAMIQIGG
ncbi:MAG TPA: GTP 3',8-cyclase MoaA [Polyangia bacterium]|jgi:cyclic pyranopterin phosphate synthase|nr:GTP 3',8-cyclase MoaA [Polyangia bacterium]